MSVSINRVVLLGNLTRDPETRQAGTTTVCTLRLAVDDRVKNRDTGTWDDRANYFDVTAFGSLAEHCAKYLAKGRQIVVDGRLHWREWQARDGQRREAVGVVADSVQFVGPRRDVAEPSGTSPGSGLGDDDIPF